MKGNNTEQFEIIAVDFDGTLCSECYPEIGAANEPLIELLKELKRNQRKLILWTCRSGVFLKDAITWCRKQGIEFDAVNDNIPEVIEQYGNNSRKIYADVYIDDKSCFPWERNEQRKKTR